jgi:methyl-accepting chemotaxis protein
LSQELKESTANTIERFRVEQEYLEDLAFDALNLSDSIRNSVKKAISCLETEEKEKAVDEAKDCLMSILTQLGELNEVVHASEATLEKQEQNLESIQMAVDFLCCEWE